MVTIEHADGTTYADRYDITSPNRFVGGLVVHVPGRRAQIKRLMESGATLVLDPSAWRGEMCLSTRNTVYRVREGFCIAVHRQDTGRSRAEFVGMRIVGWLIDEEAPQISASWRPGASAIFVRPGVLGDSVALTSAVFQVRRMEEAKSSQSVRRVTPPQRVAMADSMTRIVVAARVKGPAR